LSGKKKKKMMTMMVCAKLLELGVSKVLLDETKFVVEMPVLDVPGV
jgi:hypothetical protein